MPPRPPRWPFIGPGLERPVVVRMVRAPRAPYAGPLMLSVAVKKRRDRSPWRRHFELPTPGVVALFGRSGCGKSTVVNIIAGLLEADSGRVALDDGVLLDTQRSIDVPPERRRIGYVFQDARLFPHLSVAGNLKYGESAPRRTLRRSRYRDRPARSRLAHDAAHPPTVRRRKAARRHRARTAVPAAAAAAR